MSESQKRLFDAAMAVNPPFLTNDPFVNYCVDNHMDMDDSFVPYDKILYEDEIAAWKNSGGFVLSLNNA